MNSEDSGEQSQDFPADSDSQFAPAFCLPPEGARIDLVTNVAKDVFDISPDTALEILCVNIDMLAAQSAAESQRRLQGYGTSTPSPRSGADGISSGEATPTRVTELHFSPVGDDEGRDRVQQGLLSKRFLSKRVPPIKLREYLSRLHRYCPMSTAVYLATSLYITRFAVVEGIIAVNGKNMHRLVLAGLRVAMKTLEDLSYSHSRVAKVGGVTEHELSRLEISFCFLADFELRVDAEMLINQARLVQWNAALHGSDVS